MSISKLSKVNIYFHNDNKEELIQAIQELSCVHVLDFKETAIAKDYEALIVEDSGADIELEKRLRGLDFAIRCLSPFEKRTGIANMIAGKRIFVSKDEYDEIVNDFDDTSVVQTI